MLITSQHDAPRCRGHEKVSRGFWQIHVALHFVATRRLPKGWILEMMKTAIVGAAICMAAFAPISAHAATNIELNTGEDAAPADGLDDIWKVDGKAATVQTIGAWFPNDAGSSWIAADSVRVPGDESYVYTAMVELSDVGNVQNWSGLVWADNSIVDIVVNGFDMISLRIGGAFSGPGTAFSFDTDINGDNVWIEGINEVTFVVRNAPLRSGNNNPSGFRLDSVINSVPEPATWLMMIFGLGAVGSTMRRQKKASVRVRFA